MEGRALRDSNQQEYLKKLKILEDIRMKKLQALEVLAKMNLTCQDVEQMVDQTRGERSKTPPKKKNMIEDSARLELELAKTAKRESKREATQPRNLNKNIERENSDEDYYPATKGTSKNYRGFPQNENDHVQKKVAGGRKQAYEEQNYNGTFGDREKLEKSKPKKICSPLSKSRRREYAISSDESDEYQGDSPEKIHKGVTKVNREKQKGRPRHGSSYFEESQDQELPYDRNSAELPIGRVNRGMAPNYNPSMSIGESPYMRPVYPGLDQYGQVYHNVQQPNFNIQNSAYYPVNQDRHAGYPYIGMPMPPGMLQPNYPGFSDRAHYGLNPHTGGVGHQHIYPQHAQSHNIVAPGMPFENPTAPKMSASMYLKPLGDIGQSAKKDFTRLDKIFSDTTQRIENLMNKPSTKRTVQNNSAGTRSSKPQPEENREYNLITQMSPQAKKEHTQKTLSPPQGNQHPDAGSISFRGSPHVEESKITRNKRSHPVDWQQQPGAQPRNHIANTPDSPHIWDTDESALRAPTPTKQKALAWELSNDSPAQPLRGVKKASMMKEELVVDGEAGVSLAEAFKRRQQQTNSNIRDRSQSLERSHSKEKAISSKTFDKKELLERRKRGVVPRPPKSIGIVITPEDYQSKEGLTRALSNNRLNQKENLNSGLNMTPRGNKSSVFGESNMNVPKSPKLPPAELLDRLAKGERPQVSKQEMKELTQKNYQNLPEIVLKKQEQQKKEEARKRIEKAKEYNRNMRQTRAATPNS